MAWKLKYEEKAIKVLKENMEDFIKLSGKSFIILSQNTEGIKHWYILLWKIKPLWDKNYHKQRQMKKWKKSLSEKKIIFIIHTTLIWNWFKKEQ
jgi:uncharacterized protein YvpB